MNKMEIKENGIELAEIEKILTVKDWLKILLQMSIPVLNIIILVKTIKSKKANITLKNYLQACLVTLPIEISMGYAFNFILNSLFKHFV
ncbi:MAG: hypothetical protein ACRC0S_10130 [Fusobacteriaceae bacterium]